MKFLGVTILYGVEFCIFLLIFEWALQQCIATALPVIKVTGPCWSIWRHNWVDYTASNDCSAQRRSLSPIRSHTTHCTITVYMQAYTLVSFDPTHHLCHSWGTNRPFDWSKEGDESPNVPVFLRFPMAIVSRLSVTVPVTDSILVNRPRESNLFGTVGTACRDWITKQQVKAKM